MSVELSSFDNSWYSPGRSKFVRSIWFFVGLPLLRSSIITSSRFRSVLLRIFGCRIGNGVILKPGIRVKYPWLLEVGNYTWIGEDVWIDNLAMVRIGANACISQGAYLCTGNHDWNDPAFGLIVKPILVSDGAWIGARAILGPGIGIGPGAIAVAGSVVTKDLEAFTIYAGNPAQAVKVRTIRA